jgi:hypothetical protein
MIDTYEKCIGLFSKEDSCILIITSERNDEALLWSKESARSIDYIPLKDDAEKLVLEKLHVSNSKQKSDIGQHAEYDLIILDRICESPLFDTKKNALIWKNRQEMFYSLSNLVAVQGSIVLFSENATCLRNPSVFFYASINLLMRTFCSGTFISQLINELKIAGFSRFNSFYIYPELTVFSQLISDDRKAFRDAITSKHGLPFEIFRQPRFWFRWLRCFLQLDRWLLSCQMIWIRR